MTDEETKYTQMAKLIELLQIRLTTSIFNNYKIEADSETIRVGRYGGRTVGTGGTYQEAVFSCASEIRKQAQDLVQKIDGIMEKSNENKDI